MKQKTKKFHILTALPGVIDSYFLGGMMRKAVDKKIISVKEHNLHDYSSNKYGSVDDTPYGGGAGMVMSVEPIYKCLKKISTKHQVLSTKRRVVGFSASGKVMTQRDVERLAKYDEVIFVCGRFEGYDARVKEFLDEELAIGQYVLTGGELPALVVIDAVTRLIPGVLGNTQSAIDESHSADGVLEYPQYTKPEIFEYKEKGKKKILKVPEVLRSGNHALIKKWREENRGGSKLF